MPYSNAIFDAARVAKSRPSLAGLAVQLALLLFPSLALGLLGWTLHSTTLVVGTMAQLIGAGLLIRAKSVWRPPASPILMCLYLMAIGWVWFATSESPTALSRLAIGSLLAIVLTVFVGHDLLRSGLEPRRRARNITRRLKQRTQWPAAIDDYSSLSDVRRLARTVRDNPSLAFELFDDPRPEVHIAALAAIQRRPYWRWDEAAVVLGVARRSADPEIRALALRALASSTQIDIVLGLADYLRDPSSNVRDAACRAILRGGDSNWGFARAAIRTALADPALARDGALPGAAGLLTPLAVCDLMGWTSEQAAFAQRCVLTLLAHYRAVLEAKRDPHLPSALGEQIVSEQTPAVLRIELALLLRSLGLLLPEWLDRFTDPNQPSPVRLIAVETMLASDPTDATAANVLRGLGRQSNRETQLAVARILQRYGQLDLGLPEENPTPKQINEAVRKVMKWASGKNYLGDVLETPMPLGEGITGLQAILDDDDEDAMGGLPAPMYPASAPGLSAPRFREPKRR